MSLFKNLFCLILTLSFSSNVFSLSPDTNPAKPPYGWMAGDVNVNGISLHFYRTSNTTQPPMVLIHGYTDNALCWTDFAHALEKNYDIIMYDLRGHGFSGAPATGYGINDYTQDLAGLIKVLKLENPIIVGHSLGGCIAASYAAHFPSVPKKIVLIDPPGVGRPIFPTADDINRAANWFALDMNNLKRLNKKELIKTAANRHPAISQAARSRWADSKMQMKPQVVQSVPAIAALPDDLPNVKVPTLILKADANDAVRKMETDSVSQQYNIKIVHIKGAGHLVHLEKPEESLAALNDFLMEYK